MLTVSDSEQRGLNDAISVGQSYDGQWTMM